MAIEGPVLDGFAEMVANAIHAETADDGHAQAAATHEARDEEGQKAPVNHFFRLDLRTHAPR